MLPLLPIVQSGPVLGSGSHKSEAPLPCRAPVRTSFRPLPMGPHRLLPAPKWGPQGPSEALHWEPPSHPLLFSFCPQLSLHREPSRTQCVPQISTGLLPRSRSSCGQQPLKTKLGSVEKGSISNKKLLTSYLGLNPLSVASAATSLENTGTLMAPHLSLDIPQASQS